MRDRKSKEVKNKRICVTETATGKKTYFRAKTGVAAITAASEFKIKDVRKGFTACIMSGDEVLSLPHGTVWVDLTGEPAPEPAASEPAASEPATSEPESAPESIEAKGDF